MKYFHQKHVYMSTSCSLKIGKSHQPTSHFDMHWHNSIEIIYGYNSEYTVNVGTAEYKMSDGDILFIPSRSLHSFVKINQIDPLYFIIFKAEPIYSGGDIYRGRYDTETFNPLIKTTVKINKAMDCYNDFKNTIEQLINIMDIQPEGFRYRGVSKLYEIIALLYKYKISRNALDEAVSEDQMDNIIKSFIFIEEHFNEDISISDVAAHCGFNTKYFGRLFHKVTGSYFKDFLNDFRINQSTKLLNSNDSSITKIAYNCGFSCTATFYRAFSKKYGCSPKQFMEKYSI